MTNKKIHIGTMAIVALTSFSLLLTGCQKNDSKKNQVTSSQSVIEYQDMTEQPSDEVLAELPEEARVEEQSSDYDGGQEEPASYDYDSETPFISEESTEEIYQEPVQEEPYQEYVPEENYYEYEPTEDTYASQQTTDNDYSEATPTEEEFTFFEDAKREITSYIESEDFENLKAQGKYYVTTGIDFIFYDEPINGVYYQDLKEDAKTAILNDVHIIDEAIMAYFPTYKETISSKYQVAADFLSEKYLDVMDAIRNYLGDENYEAVGEIKDQVIGDLSDAKDNALSFIKDKYENWRNRK